MADSVYEDQASAARWTTSHAWRVGVRYRDGEGLKLRAEMPGAWGNALRAACKHLAIRVPRGR